MLGMSERSFRRSLRGRWPRIVRSKARRRPRAACRPRSNGCCEPARAGRSSTSTTISAPTMASPELHLDQDHLAARRLGVQGTQAGAHRRRRPRKPCVGMMLRQDGSRHEWLAGQAVRPDRHHQRSIRPSWSRRKAPRPSSPTRGSQHTDRGSPGRQGSTHPGRPRPPPARIEHIAAYRRSERAATASSKLACSRRSLHRRHLPARPQPPLHHPARTRQRLVPLEHPGQIDDILCRRTDRTVARACATKGASSRSPLPRQTPLRGHGPLRTEPSRAARYTAKAHRNPKVDKWTAARPDHFPTGQTATTEADI